MTTGGRNKQYNGQIRDKWILCFPFPKLIPAPYEMVPAASVNPDILPLACDLARSNSFESLDCGGCFRVEIATVLAGVREL
jgi:hypothetical protein